ncbi:MAG TPA: sugar ABC transporter substrate-binding protein [Solirubrobacterales bacterium]|nr:sugar ABC transporter substrate-binding protein [Solirubrobacterales bacterium]
MAAALAVVVAACGGGGSSDEVTGISAGTGETASTAATAAKKAAGSPTELPQVTVGVVDVLASSEASQRLEVGLKDASKVLGWKLLSCDAQGEPAGMQRCAETLLNQEVEVLFLLATEPTPVHNALVKAKSKGVPVIGFGGQTTNSPLLAGLYYPNEHEAGEIAGEYIVEQLESLKPDERSMIVHSIAAIWGEERTAGMLEKVEPAGIKIAAKYQTDLANVEAGTLKATTDELTANPEVKAIYDSFDAAGRSTAQAVAQKFPGKKFPERPLVVTFHADLTTLEMMREGKIDAVVDVPYDATAWIAADQAAQFLARETPPSKEPEPKYPLPFLKQELFTAEDEFPPEGQYREPQNDFVTFFTTKWQQEFTNIPKSGGAGE